MLWDALVNALSLIARLDADVVQYATRSLYIAFAATVAAGLVGIPLGVFLGEADFPGRRLVLTALNTLLSVPTVVIGLLVYAMISRAGPLGGLHLLFTENGIILGEVLLILPVMTALSASAIARIDRDVRRTALALGASGAQAVWTVISEARFAMLAAVVAAYGRVIGEVGVAMIVGGNADRFTRTLTTAAVLSIDMGYFEMAMALGLVLLALSFVFNIGFQWIQGQGRS